MCVCVSVCLSVSVSLTHFPSLHTTDNAAVVFSSAHSMASVFCEGILRKLVDSSAFEGGWGEFAHEISQLDVARIAVDGCARVRVPSSARESTPLSTPTTTSSALPTASFFAHSSAPADGGSTAVCSKCGGSSVTPTQTGVCGMCGGEMGHATTTTTSHTNTGGGIATNISAAPDLLVTPPSTELSGGDSTRGTGDIDGGGDSVHSQATTPNAPPASVTNPSPPACKRSYILLSPEYDAFALPHATETLEKALASKEGTVFSSLRSIIGGHVSAFLLFRGTWADAVEEACRKLQR